MSRTRTLTAGFAAAALLLAATPVSAATESYAAEASSAGLSLSIAGNDVLEVGGTYASAVPGEALATAAPVSLAGTAVGGREARSDGPLVADPVDAADRCLGAVPAPLDALIGAGVACGDATAEGAVPAAVATAGVAEIDLLALDGDLLAPLNELLATLPLDALLGPIEDELLGTLQAAVGDVRAQCVAALAPLDVGGLLGAIGEAAPDELAELLETLTGLLGAAVPTACDVLGGVTDLLLGGDLLGTITSGDLLDRLTGAGGIVSVQLLETESGVARDGDEVVAVAGPTEGGAIGITVDIPLLDELLGDLLTGAVAPLLTQLTGLLAPLGDAVAPLPVVGDLVDGLLTDDLGDLVGGPLLQVAVAPGAATVTADLTDGATEGDATPALVELGGTLFSLPVLAGVDDALDAVAGVLDDTVLAELRATPLAELLSVELLPRSVADAEVGGLPGTQATSGAVSVQVLGALAGVAGGPLVDLQVAPARAGVGTGDASTPTTPAGPDATPVASPPAAPAAPGTLPVTGGGAALAALAALGAAAALRRRG